MTHPTTNKSKVQVYLNSAQFRDLCNLQAFDDNKTAKSELMGMALMEYITRRREDVEAGKAMRIAQQQEVAQLVEAA